MACLHPLPYSSSLTPIFLFTHSHIPLHSLPYSYICATYSNIGSSPNRNAVWRRLIRCLKLQVIFCKRADNYRALLRKMTCEDKASYDSTPPCMRVSDDSYVPRHIPSCTGITPYEYVSECRRTYSVTLGRTCSVTLGRTCSVTLGRTSLMHTRDIH